MEFTQKKLPLELMPRLYRLKIETVQPFALMLAPVYVFLPSNEKLVSVKAPLDFFTPAELERLKAYKFLYLSDFVTTILPYREAGQLIRRLLLWKSPASAEQSPDTGFSPAEYPEAILPPSPFELSDAILRTIGPLWWRYTSDKPGIEPFMAAVFANELCDLIPGEKLLKAREESIENFDKALLRSGWVVFLALHLGYSDLDFLNELRFRVFEENIKGDPELVPENEVDELIAFSYVTFKNIHVRLIKGDLFGKIPGAVAQKISNRIDRIRLEFLSKGRHAPTIYGERGFIDV
jgi:hypothetical protein